MCMWRCNRMPGHGSGCSFDDCTEIRDIVFRNLTFQHSGGTGGVVCFPARYGCSCCRNMAPRLLA